MDLFKNRSIVFPCTKREKKTEKTGVSEVKFVNHHLLWKDILANFMKTNKQTR